MATLTMNGSPDDTQEAKSPNIPSAIPLVVKNSILDCTRTAVGVVKNAVGSCLVAGALALGSAPAMSADQQDAAAVAVLQAKGFTGPSAQGVLALSNFVREKQASGGLAPTEAVSITTVEPLASNGTGLDQLVNTGSRLPKKTFLEVADVSTLTNENYATVVEKLFNPADIDIWLTKTDGSPMSAQEKADYKESLEATKKRWLAKLPELSSTGKQETINRWFTLFNVLATKPVHGSREEYRRGLIAANSMAGYTDLTPERRKALSSATATQMAEYIFMTDSNAQMIKIERKFNEPGKAPFVLKYMVASDESLQKSGFLQGIEANTLAFGKWSEDQTKTYGLQVRAMEAKAELSGAKAELSKSTAELADANKRNAAITEFVDLHKNANNLAKVILGQFDELKAKRGDKEFILALNSNLETWKSLKTKIEILVASEYGKKVINPESRDSLISLFNTIQQNAKLNGLG